MTSALDKESGEVPEIDLENLDDLLMALTAKELEELNGDFDPDVSVILFLQRWQFLSLICQVVLCLLGHEFGIVVRVLLPGWSVLQS